MEIITVIGSYGDNEVPDTWTLKLFTCNEKAADYSRKLIKEGASSTVTNYVKLDKE